MPNDRIEELFDAARRMRGGERTAFLDRACADAPGIRAEVESLLEHLESDGDFLARSAAVDQPALAERLSGGDYIGRYRLIRLLGEGGMGVVFLAEQDRPRREVAIKIVHPAFLSPTAAARLELEGEALGRLQHAAIARVIEVGQEPGPLDVPLTFIAMERIEGEPITAAADAHGLDTRARLELVAQVADAMQHAHDRGVVHRDLKPSNVLVDADGAPHVLDFGIARLLGEGVEALTVSGHAIGTPAYMAPEQLRGEAAASAPGVDVFALGGLTYELLAHRPPYVPTREGPLAMARALERSDPPPLRKVAPSVERDVATIVATALAVDPAQRYASADDFAADVRRYLAFEPIRARPPSAFYRMGRFARRRRAVLATVALILIVALGATLGLRNSHAATFEKAAQVRALLGIVETGLESKDPFVGDALDPGDVAALADAEAWIANELSDYPELAGELQTTLARIYRNRGDYERSAEQASAAQARISEASGPSSDGALIAANVLCLALIDLGRFAEAEALLRDARERWIARGKARDAGALSALHNLGLAIKLQNRFSEAEAIYRECLAGREEAFGPDDLGTVTTKTTLARVLEDTGDPAGAVEMMRQVLAADIKREGRDAPWTLITISMLASPLIKIGELDEAEELLLEAVHGLEGTLGPGHADTLAARRNLVVLYGARGDDGRARKILIEMLPAVREQFGTEDYRTLEILARIAAASVALEDWSAAVDDWNAVVPIADAVRGPADERTLGWLEACVEALRQAGREADADARRRELVARVREHLPDDDPVRLRIESELALDTDG